MEALIFPALLFIVMYFALIRPQQRQAKQARELMASLEIGDEVITNSGIHGFINSLDDRVVWLEVSDGVELKISKAAIAGRVADDEGEDEDDDVNAGVGDSDEID